MRENKKKIEKTFEIFLIFCLFNTIYYCCCVVLCCVGPSKVGLGRLVAICFLWCNLILTTWLTCLADLPSLTQVIFLSFLFYVILFLHFNIFAYWKLGFLIYLTLFYMRLSHSHNLNCTFCIFVRVSPSQFNMSPF
jgi:hypothetical protein